MTEDDHGSQQLASSTDPTDFGFIVFADGHILVGGREPQLFVDEAAVDRIDTAIDRYEKHKDAYHENVYEPFLPSDDAA